MMVYNTMELVMLPDHHYRIEVVDGLEQFPPAIYSTCKVVIGSTCLYKFEPSHY
jgi:hypothetical protein